MKPAILLWFLSGLTPITAMSLSAAKDEIRRSTVNRIKATSDSANTPQPRTVNQPRSTTWSGGVISNDRYQSVTAEVIIPNITFPYGYNSQTTYSSSVWVGISGFGDLCDVSGANGLIQGGFYYLYDKEGDFGVFAFYEWYPDGPVFLDDTQQILTNIGDHVRMTVTQAHNNTGTYTWENLTQGKKFEIALTAPAKGNLCTNTAEWVVESFMTPKDHSQLFPDFGSLTFNNIKAITESGKAASLSNAIHVNAEPYLDGRYLTSCEVHPASDSTTCKWTGYKGIFP